ncbi:MAG TPA: hypothetical protein ENI64_13415 [Gammaproteobacteria bacterium]|nr:hypothetical protein [Gammaproteobacteria bacterium]
MDRNFTLIKIRPTIRQDRLNVLVREVNQYDTLASLEKSAANRRVIRELLYAGLTCAGAALGYVALTAEGLAAPVTAGGTALLIPVTTAGTLASSASCGVYTGRVINEFTGNTAYNEYLDDSLVFGSVMNALDVISLLRAMDTPKIFSQARIRKAMYGELAGAIGSAFSASSSAADGVIGNLAVAILADERKD